MNWYEISKKQYKHPKEKMVAPFARSMSYASTHALYKFAQTGEWWISEGRAEFADGDIGDMNHEAYVIDAIKRKYVYDEFDKGEWIDWDGFKKELAREELTERYGEETAEGILEKDAKQTEDAYLKKLKEMGMTDEEYAIAEGIGDARVYGMREMGWKRVKGNNIQTQTLTVDDLKEIANGLWDINNDLNEDSDVTFNIEVVATGAFYTDVPYKLISDGAPSMLREYQRVYAKKRSWYRIAQIWNVEIGDEIDDKITALYELEYKYSMVRDRPFNGVEERRQNILNELESRLRDVVGDVKDVLLRTFKKWLDNHALLSADTWSNQRAGEYSESGEIEVGYGGMVSEYIRYAIHGGEYRILTDTSAYDRFFREMVGKAFQNLRSFPYLSKLLEESMMDFKEFRKSDLSEMGYKEFGEMVGKRFINEDQADEWISRLTVKDLEPEFVGFDSIKTFADVAEGVGLGHEILVEFYKRFVFPSWVQYWRGQGIAGTRKTVANIYRKLHGISFEDMGNALAVISLALNASHQNGDMMEYIVEEGGGAESEIKYTLEVMTKGIGLPLWNEELKEIGVQI